MKHELDAAQTEILLDKPLLAFDKLLLAKGDPASDSNWDGPNHIGEEWWSCRPSGPTAQQTTIYKGAVSDMDLHWDGRRILFSDGSALWEINVDGTRPAPRVGRGPAR